MVVSHQILISKNYSHHKCWVTIWLPTLCPQTLLVSYKHLISYANVEVGWTLEGRLMIFAVFHPADAGDISRLNRWPLRWTKGRLFQVWFRVLREILVSSRFLCLTRLKPVQKGQVTCPKWQSDWVAPRPLLPATRPPTLLSHVAQKLNSPCHQESLIASSHVLLKPCANAWGGKSVSEGVEKHDFCPLQQGCQCLFSPAPSPPAPTHLVQSQSPNAGSPAPRQHLSKESRLQNTLLLWGLFLFSRNLLTHLID